MREGFTVAGDNGLAKDQDLAVGLGADDLAVLDRSVTGGLDSAAALCPQGPPLLFLEKNLICRTARWTCSITRSQARKFRRSSRGGIAIVASDGFQFPTNSRIIMLSACTYAQYHGFMVMREIARPCIAGNS